LVNQVYKLLFTTIAQENDNIPDHLDLLKMYRDQVNNFSNKTFDNQLTELMGKPLWAQTLMPTNHWPIVLLIKINLLNPIGLICQKSSAIIAGSMVIKKKEDP
jgi:hypothetical protein